ncbi:MAG: hypothetical protein Salg2KO_14950 [Salibacteraceae bacterium]
MPKEPFFSVTDIFKDRRKLTVFLICVGVSILSWIMISLGREYNSTVVMPVRYINFPQNKVLLNNIPNRLAVSLNGTGFDLLNYDDRLSEDTLIINLDNLKMSVSGDFERGYLDPAILTQALQKRIDGGVGINRVLSDSIEFLFDLKVSRFIPVKAQVEYALAPGFVLLDSIMTSPTEVEIYGPLSILDTLSYVRTQRIQIGEIQKSKKYRASMIKTRIGQDARIKPDSVFVELKVDQLTEKQFMIEPTQLNVPDSLKLLTFPTAVEIVAQVPLSRYNDINAKDFKLTVDFNKLQEGYPVLPIDVSRWPSVVQRISTNPSQVEIVLVKVE